MKKSLLLWQTIGFIFTSIAGILLHFLYEWSGDALLVAPFSAVNESIWEHMKLLFVSLFIFTIFESRYFKDDFKNFWCAKLRVTVLGLITIPVLYYTYTGIFGRSADWFNIAIFFIAAAITFLSETRRLLSNKPCILSNKAVLVIFIIIALLFVIFTFYPPEIPLFQDPRTSLYGRSITANNIPC